MTQHLSHPLEKHSISAGLLKSVEFVANMISVVDRETASKKKNLQEEENFSKLQQTDGQ